MTDTIRLAAARVLQAVEREESTLGAALDQAQREWPDRRDRALLVELATGVLRWRNEIDAVIGSAAGRSGASLDPVSKLALRIGVYQFRHLDRIPTRAIVYESVEVARALGAPRAAGFVNAVLRTVIRRGPAIALPRRPSDPDNLAAQLAYLTTTCSHPNWLVKRWLARYGFDATERWCRWNNTPPAVTVRARGGTPLADLTAALDREGLQWTPARFMPDALELAPGQLGRLPPSVSADLAVQDEGSQLVALASGARPGDHVLDVCAAPGGKTVLLAQMIGRDAAASRLVAADRRPARVAILRNTLDRERLPVAVVALDAEQGLPFGPVFDRVLLDAPCSGLGTLRRDPDLKWSRTAEDLPRLAEAQGRMLVQAAAVVRPGGRLVYATCSSEPDENWAVIARFLESDLRFRLERLPVDRDLPATLIDERGCLVTTPADHQLDAFFAAVLVRQETT